ncbi:TrkA C-terminal domain-containing protein [Evansella tamaricis]|uniref:aspartate-alanine antiporter-like transporter n=1 Tax=Evansella tamaricis TaxID=2069301 RepID=UPI001FE59A6B|nr:TrkA C-terminal domain-containing protein [Evansella tamaricis]
MQSLLQDPLILIFLILFLGSFVGQLKFKGLNLGASGVLLIGMVFGHFGYEIPSVLQNLGLSLFIVAVGLQAGPRFFRMMKSSGIVFGIIGFLVVFIASVTTVIVSKLFQLSAPISIGLMTGALTSTPGLAAALEATQDPIASVGYGVAYPFGVIAVVLFIQLFPRFIKVDLKADLRKTIGPVRHQGSPRSMMIRVEKEEFHKKTLKELRLNRNSSVVISRVIRGDRSFLGRNDTVLLKGDDLIVVGYPEEIERFTKEVGSEETSEVKYADNLKMKRITVEADEMIGKSLPDIKLRAEYGVTGD